jgi:hypothetical protein
MPAAVMSSRWRTRGWVAVSFAVVLFAAIPLLLNTEGLKTAAIASILLFV